MQISINSKQASIIIKSLNEKLENPEMLTEKEIEEIQNLKDEIIYQDW